MTVRLDVKAVSRCLAGIIVLLALLSVAAAFVEFVLGRPSVYGLIDFLSANAEGNAPTWVASLLLATAAALAAVIAMWSRQNDDRHWRHWGALSLLFLFFSLDEVAQIHEMANRLDEVIDGGGILRFTWVIPGGAALVAIGVFFAPFARALAPATRRRLLSAAALFVLAGFGLELVGAVYFDNIGTNLGYGLLTTVEEAGEQTGAALFVLALLKHLEGLPGSVRFESRGAN